MYIGTTKIKFFLTYAHIDYISSIIDVQRKFKREDKGEGERKEATEDSRQKVEKANRSKSFGGTSMHKGQSSKEQRVRLREGSTMRAVPYVHCGPLAQNENLVCKARVRIRLYERFPRFPPFRPRSQPSSQRHNSGMGSGFWD